MANKEKMNILRVFAMSLLLCSLVFALCVVFVGVMDVAEDKLEELNPRKTGDMDNTLWLIRHLMYILCVPFLMLVLKLIYIKVGQVRYREWFWCLMAAFVFTFAILLPVAVMYSKGHPPVPDLETGEDTLSFIQKSAEWFMWQFVIFIPPMLYSKVRSDECRNVADGEEIAEDEADSEEV